MLIVPLLLDPALYSIQHPLVPLSSACLYYRYSRIYWAHISASACDICQAFFFINLGIQGSFINHL